MRRLDRFEKDFAKDLRERVGADARVVDIPCGNGRFYEVFSDVAELTMIDLSANMLEAVRERYGVPGSVRLLEGDIMSMPLGDGEVDLCFCMRLFHHMRDDTSRLTALRELSRVSTRYVGLTFYNKHCFRYYWRKLLHKKIRGNYITFAHMVSLAREAGLEPVERRPAINSIEQQCLALFRKV